MARRGGRSPEKNDGRSGIYDLHESVQSDRNDNGVSSRAETKRRRRSSEMKRDRLLGEEEEKNSIPWLQSKPGRFVPGISSNQFGSNSHRPIIPGRPRR